MTTTRLSLLRAIRTHAAKLDMYGLGLDGEVLLAAIARVESNLGANNVPRREPAYCPGGHYYLRSEAVRADYARFGVDAASSWGAWQVMFPTARELGYNGGPDGLGVDDACARWAVEYINRRAIQRGARSLSQIADAYNSGSHRDRFVPVGYVNKVLRAYTSPATAAFLRGE